MATKICILRPEDLGPYVVSLRELEAGLLYPIADGADNFCIDHGPDYHSFFSQMGEKARFVVAVEGDKAVGSLAGVWRAAEISGGVFSTVYLGDLKLAKDYRGRGLAARILWRGLLGSMTRVDLRVWSLAWGVAMRGARGDLMRSARGWHPARLAMSFGRASLFFVDLETLAELADGPEPAPPGGIGLDFSPEFSKPGAPMVVSTRGRKDYQLQSTGAPWPLIHLSFGPAQWRRGLAMSLRGAAREALEQEPGGIACFALDERLIGIQDWLAARGIVAGASCTIYGFSWSLRLRRALGRAEWLHISSSQI